MSKDNSHIQAIVANAEEVEVMSRLNLLGGIISEVSRDGEFRTAIGATIPKKNIADFKTWLHTFTKGKSSFREDIT